MIFEWDRSKELANFRKHGVWFREASTVFGDPLSLTISDPDHSDEEDRFVIAGMSDRRRVLIVVHTIMQERVRLISARAATNHEKHRYEETSTEGEAG